MQLPIDVLQAAAIGLMICEGVAEEEARRICGDVRDQRFLRTARKVGSVAMTLQAHGLMKDSVH